MEIDIPDVNDGNSHGIKENGFHLYPCSVHDTGEGLPYAPIDWPNPGDKWSWKVGRRVAVSGYFLDRYLYLPDSLQTGPKRIGGFASKLSVEQYLRKEFPNADIDAFFASFSWRVPSKESSWTKDDGEDTTNVSVPSGEITEYLVSDSQIGTHSQIGTACCKAGNKMCSSLIEANDSSSETMVCDVCCSEPRFCRDCCCIHCSKTINPVYGGYSFIKCEAVVGEGLICGHIAHLPCGLRSYMAGTVGGSIGLDAEYFCRRCDTRTDLVSHVTKLLKTCESIETRGDVEKILNVGVCVLRGTQRASSKMLLQRIEFVMSKLKSGIDLEDIWKMEDVSAVAAGGALHLVSDSLESTAHQDPQGLRSDSPPPLYSGKFDHRIESLKLEDEIHQVLQSLRESQESEYEIAKERLRAQKNLLLNLYQRLGDERSELSRRTSSAEADALLDAILERVDQIKREAGKLRDMKEVAKGFGKTSKDVLKKHFGLDMEH